MVQGGEALAGGAVKAEGRKGARRTGWRWRPAAGRSGGRAAGADAPRGRILRRSGSCLQGARLRRAGVLWNAAAPLGRRLRRCRRAQPRPMRPPPTPAPLPRLPPSPPPAENQHFLIPHPTRAYMDLLAALPDEFAGSKARLLPLVDFLCTEMAASFEGRGLTLPPWRRAQALASKWLPARSRDASAGGGAPGRSPSPDAEVSGGSSCGLGSGGRGGGGGSPFDRLEEWQLRATARERRGGGYRGLLSDKLLGGSPPPPPPRRCSSAPAPACAAAGVAAAAPPAGAAAGPSVRDTALKTTAVAAAAVPGGGSSAAFVRAGSVEVRSFGAAGTLSRHPPVCSGQPATWKVVRAAPSALQPPAAQRPRA
jgi:hypothetical protein